jgi:hypothetical protein
LPTCRLCSHLPTQHARRKVVRGKERCGRGARELGAGEERANSVLLPGEERAYSVLLLGGVGSIGASAYVMHVSGLGAGTCASLALPRRSQYPRMTEECWGIRATPQHSSVMHELDYWCALEALHLCGLEVRAFRVWARGCVTIEVVCPERLERLEAPDAGADG